MRREHPSRQGYEPFSFQDTEPVSPLTAKSPQTCASTSRRRLEPLLPVFADRDAVAVPAMAPGPGKARKLSSAKVQPLLRRAGRSRYLQSRADEITSSLQSEQLEAQAGSEAAYSATTQALVAVIGELNTQIQTLQEQVEECFGQHPTNREEPSNIGRPRSWPTSTPAAPPTAPQKQSTASSKPLSASPAAFGTSLTTDSDAYSPPAATGPTGSAPSTMRKCEGPE